MASTSSRNKALAATLKALGDQNEYRSFKGLASDYKVGTGHCVCSVALRLPHPGPLTQGPSPFSQANKPGIAADDVAAAFERTFGSGDAARAAFAEMCALLPDVRKRGDLLTAMAQRTGSNGEHPAVTGGSTDAWDARVAAADTGESTHCETALQASLLPRP